MKCLLHLLLLGGSIAMGAITSPAALGENDIRGGKLFTLTDTAAAPNGGWCWYQDDRAIVDEHFPDGPLLLVSSVSAGESPESGDIDLLWRNLGTGEQGHFELDDQLEQDDHNVAALYVRPDGRYLAMWSRHGGDSFTRWRISSSPHDPTSWEPIQKLDNGAGATYNNVYFLPGDNDGEGRLYNFTRARNFDPNVQVSYNHGSSWQLAGKLLTEGGGGDRPYVRYASDGKRIHLITTDRHPRNYANNIYHGYVQNGVLYDSDGRVIDETVFDPQGVAPAALTTVFQNGTEYGGVVMNRAWTVDLELDAAGNPVCIFSARVEDNNEDHRFFYARHDGDKWHVVELAHAGGYLYRREDDYTGLVAINPVDTNVVFMSSDIDPRTGDRTRKYEIYRGATSDAGATWQWKAITENSTMDNLRPLVPQRNSEETVVLWLRGEFRTYTDYDTKVVGLQLAADAP